MKKYIFFAALMFVAISTSNVINAWTFPITNGTDKNLLIQVELQGSSNSYFLYKKPGEVADFSWPFGNPRAGYCLNNIKVVIVDDALLKQLQQFNIIDKNGNVDNGKAGDWFENHPLRKTAKITNKIAESGNASDVMKAKKMDTGIGGVTTFCSAGYTFTIKIKYDGTVMAYWDTPATPLK